MNKITSLGFYVVDFYNATVGSPAGTITLPDEEERYYHYKVIPLEGYINSYCGCAPFELIRDDGAKKYTDIKYNADGDPYHTGVINAGTNQIMATWSEDETRTFVVTVRM